MAGEKRPFPFSDAADILSIESPDIRKKRQCISSVADENYSYCAGDTEPDMMCMDYDTCSASNIKNGYNALEPHVISRFKNRQCKHQGSASNFKCSKHRNSDLQNVLGAHPISSVQNGYIVHPVPNEINSMPAYNLHNGHSAPGISREHCQSMKSSIQAVYSLTEENCNNNNNNSESSVCHRCQAGEPGHIGHIGR